MSDSSVGPEQTSADSLRLLSARLFLAAGLCLVGKCNGRGETGGPLLARKQLFVFEAQNLKSNHGGRKRTVYSDRAGLTTS